MRPDNKFWFWKRQDAASTRGRGNKRREIIECIQSRAQHLLIDQTSIMAVESLRVDI